MALKKSALYSKLWNCCDELRGSMDASQYKDYVLTLLFLKYLSDKYSAKEDSLFIIPEDANFNYLIESKGRKDIGERINAAKGKILALNPTLKGSMNDVCFNNEEKLGKGEAKKDRLSNLIGHLESLNLSQNNADGDDLLGDAYEYLMQKFASASGKDKGQFYTSAEVSLIMAKIININPKASASCTVYDPTCGSGSLLLKVRAQFENDVTLYGQEKDNATACLARMNMVIHGCPTAQIEQGDTLSEPSNFGDSDGVNRLKQFDHVVANPPFSTKSWQNGVDLKNDARFALGTPPEKNGDYAFLLHILASLKPTGTGAVILPHGVLFRGNAEGEIRRKIIDKGYIKGIIGLPANLFYGTGIPACIIILDKAQASTRSHIYMINASKDFIKDGNKNKLQSRDIHKIVATFNEWQEVLGYSRLVPIAEIKQNEYNLNLPRYIANVDSEVKHDLERHLNGGIPKDDIDGIDWAVFATVRNHILQEHDRFYTIKSDNIRSAIVNSSEYTEHANKIRQIFNDWHQESSAYLAQLAQGCNAKQVIDRLAERALHYFKDVALVDKYAIYQHLMDYWASVMQDDIWHISTDGWKVDATKVISPKKSSKNTKKEEDAKIKQDAKKEEDEMIVGGAKYKIALLTEKAIIDHYYPAERDIIVQLEEEESQANQEFEALIEEHSDGALEGCKNDEEKCTVTSLKDGKRNADPNDKKIIDQALELSTRASALKKQIKAKRESLSAMVWEKIKDIPAEEIKRLTIDGKWFKLLEDKTAGELDTSVQALVARLRELDERYAVPLPDLVAKVDEYSRRVDRHLQGLVCA